MENYFALYDIPASFHPDQAVVKAKFYELSRKYHPDRFTTAGNEAMMEALRMAAANNEAYRTLRDPDALMAYVLKLHGLLEDEEKYTLPPGFLMEMMELNEAVSDYEDMPDSESARLAALNGLAEQMEQWQQTAGPLTARYDAGDQSEALLLQVKDAYFRKKYLLRISERIYTFAPRF